ncbi:MAG: hypothetical protein II978_03065 [Clostridia bacterium]|nr:hypothetical protein [Clostridia bacterium]
MLNDFIFSCNIDSVAHSSKPSKLELGAINNRVILDRNFVNVTFDEFVKKVAQEGKSFLPAHFTNETRTNATWEYQFIFGLDIEHGETLQEAVDICKTYNLLPNLIYTTFSHTEEEHRFRIVWFMEEVITDVRLQKFIQIGLMRFFKGADKICKDRARMLNGSAAGAWYRNDEAVLTVPNLFIALNDLFRQDNNASKNTLSFAKQVGVNIVNGYLDCKIVNEQIEDLTQPNLYVSSNKNNVFPYSRNNGISRSYCINFSHSYITAEQETYEIEKFKSSRKLIRNFDFLLLKGKCQLFRDGLEMKHKIDHGEMFGMLTNLLSIQGADKYVKEVLDNVLKTTSQSYDEKYSNIVNTVNQIKKVGYEPMKCCNFCSFYGTCKSESTMINHTETMKNKATQVKSEVLVRDIEEVRRELGIIFDDFVKRDNSKDTLFVVKAPTGVGKTESFINIVDKVDDGLVYAAPTHKLIRNVADRLTQAGYRENVDFMVYPDLPEEFEDKELIEKLYACGAYKRAGAELQRISKTDTGIKEYLESKKRCENFDKLILITHQRLIYSPLKTQPKKYVIDEDIILNTMFPVQRVKSSDLRMVVDYVSKSDYSHITALKSFYDSVMGTDVEAVGDTPRAILPDKDEMIKILLPLIKTNAINSNIISFLTSDMYIMDGKREFIYYIKKNHFNVPFGSDILILSATVNEHFTKAAYPNASFLDLGQIKYQGNLYQIPARSLSRSCIRRNLKGYANYSKTLCNKYLGDDYHTITFPEFLPETKTDKSINLWNCLGLDNFQDKDLAVVGTPHCPEIVYSLLASILGFNINNVEKDYRLIRRNGFEFYFQSFSLNFMLCEIQLYMIESVLMQCIGRARLINNPDRKVLCLSNFMLPQAQLLNYSNAEVKELLRGI